MKQRTAKKRAKIGPTKAELARMNAALQQALERTRLALAQEKQTATKAGELARAEAAQRNDLIGRMTAILRRVEPDIYRIMFEPERLPWLPPREGETAWVGDRALRRGMPDDQMRQWLATLEAEVYRDKGREPVALFQVRRGGAALGDAHQVAMKLTDFGLTRYPEFFEHVAQEMVLKALAAAGVVKNFHASGGPVVGRLPAEERPVQSRPFQYGGEAGSTPARSQPVL